LGALMLKRTKHSQEHRQECLCYSRSALAY
jgi:hypothetical protein